MKSISLAILFLSWLGVVPVLAQHTSQDSLPEDHLLFTMQLSDDRLEGANEYMEGFKVSVELPKGSFADGLKMSELTSLVRDREIVGMLTYPHGATTPIRYEVVRHRDADDIYMKTTMGYFLWESASVQGDRLYFVIDWWYCPPARGVDLEALIMVQRLLAEPAEWNRQDDRDCDEDIETGKWSLFCALKHASIESMGEYNHHNAAMQTVRFVIEDLDPDQTYEHALMDFNNAPTTNHEDVLRVLDIARKQIEQELEEVE
jgi:hypothetical protein